MSIWKHSKLNLIDFVDELYPVLNRIGSLAKKLDSSKKDLLKNDFISFLYFIRNNKDICVYDAYTIELFCLIVNSPENFNQTFEKIKNRWFKILEKKAKDTVESMNLDRKDSGDINQYSIDSFEFMDEKDIDELKNILYEFAEIILKVDGATEEEIKIAFNDIAEFFQNQGSVNTSNQKQETPKLNKEQAIIKNTSGEKTILKPDLDSVLAELNDLVGMDNIKNDIHSLINVIKSNKQRKEAGLPEHKISLHLVFLGPPGTGKTTIARVLVDIYYALGIIPAANFKETDRSDLVAGYVGQTAIKTDAVIKEALNGVLFIDEAYTLKRGNSDNDYGQEAIDILLKRMEDFRDNLIVIVAGYETEMAVFINSNPGLKSRFNKYFHFKDYEPSELTDIFKRMAEKEEYRLSPDTLNKVNELFGILYSKKDDRFANARLARNIFERTVEKLDNRTVSLIPVPKEILTTIEAEDIPFIEFTNNGNL